jgi:hypothetical protein
MTEKQAKLRRVAQGEERTLEEWRDFWAPMRESNVRIPAKVAAKTVFHLLDRLAEAEAIIAKAKPQTRRAG